MGAAQAAAPPRTPASPSRSSADRVWRGEAPRVDLRDLQPLQKIARLKHERWAERPSRAPAGPPASSRPSCVRRRARLLAGERCGLQVAPRRQRAQPSPNSDQDRWSILLDGPQPRPPLSRFDSSGQEAPASRSGRPDQHHRHEQAPLAGRAGNHGAAVGVADQPRLALEVVLRPAGVVQASPGAGELGVEEPLELPSASSRCSRAAAMSPSSSHRGETRRPPPRPAARRRAARAVSSAPRLVVLPLSVEVKLVEAVHRELDLERDTLWRRRGSGSSSHASIGGNDPHLSRPVHARPRHKGGRLDALPPPSGGEQLERLEEGRRGCLGLAGDRRAAPARNTRRPGARGRRLEQGSAAADQRAATAGAARRRAARPPAAARSPPRRRAADCSTWWARSAAALRGAQRPAAASRARRAAAAGASLVDRLAHDGWRKPKRRGTSAGARGRAASSSSSASSPSRREAGRSRRPCRARTARPRPRRRRAARALARQRGELLGQRRRDRRGGTPSARSAVGARRPARRGRARAARGRTGCRRSRKMAASVARRRRRAAPRPPPG